MVKKQGESGSPEEVGGGREFMVASRIEINVEEKQPAKKSFLRNGRILDHLRIQHSGDHFFEREELGTGFFVTHPQGRDEPDDRLVSRVEKLRSRLGKLLPEWRPVFPQVHSETTPFFHNAPFFTELIGGGFLVWEVFWLRSSIKGFIFAHIHIRT